MLSCLCQEMAETGAFAMAQLLMGEKFLGLRKNKLPGGEEHRNSQSSLVPQGLWLQRGLVAPICLLPFLHISSPAGNTQVQVKAINISTPPSPSLSLIFALAPFIQNE